MEASGFQADLDQFLQSVPSAGAALTRLAEAGDAEEFGDAMRACVEIEAAKPSPGWRIAWTQKAEEGISCVLQNSMSVSEAKATDGYWFSAARFSERTADSPDYFGPMPKRKVNIGWLLGVATADDAFDALIIISAEAMIDLTQNPES